MTTPPNSWSAVPDWQASGSGNAVLRLSAASDPGAALRMDFDFHGGRGFVVARHPLRRSMPKEYAINFRLRGRGAINHLELKLVDSSGQNVWRRVFHDLRPPAKWRRIRIESRDIEFAWGPSGGADLAELGFVDLAIVAGEGGTGTLWMADLQIEDRTPRQLPVCTASSAVLGFPADAGLGGSGWKPTPEDRRPWLIIDAGEPRVMGGVVIDWLGDAPVKGFRIFASNTGRRWRSVYRATRAGGKRSYVYLPGLKTRWLRLQLPEPSAGVKLRLESFEFSRSIDAFWFHLAAAEARGWHPRWLHREQTVWTPIGTAHGTSCALMNGDGMVEVGLGSYSLEPMIFIEDRLYTWADFTPQQALEDGWIPQPSVVWQSASWSFAVHGEATASGAIRLRLRFENRGSSAVAARLFLVIRPFQVTPPWQHFRTLGGVSRILDLRLHEGAIWVNDRDCIVPLDPLVAFGAMSFDEGCIAADLWAGTLPRHDAVHDPCGFASGVLELALGTPAGSTCERRVICQSGRRPVGDEPNFDWRAGSAMQQWSGNGWAGEVIRAALTATAHVLVTRDGAALQPGPRRYTRSWIRDGAMMSAALLRMGHVREVREFIRWYAPHQREDGFVPCCVDREGVDWLVEHDSHGQLIALIADCHRFAPDLVFLREVWPFVAAAAGCIERLLEPPGLLPISVSHEGYLAEPVHSYWDDFWALRGMRDAVELARVLELPQSGPWGALALRIEASLFASIGQTRQRRDLPFIPGSVEWADFDPTATANALYLLDVPTGLEREAVEHTFDAYLRDWRRRRTGELPSPSYTPYEIRIIGAFVRLGRRAAALELLDFFLKDCRPRMWNQWPEIALQDGHTAAHVGDLPHTWIAAEYVLAVRSLFAYERIDAGELVVAAGLAAEWIEGEGVEVRDMPTPYGALTYGIRLAAADTVRIEITSRVSARILLRPPLPGALRRVVVNGREHADFQADSVTLVDTPAEIICYI